MSVINNVHAYHRWINIFQMYIAHSIYTHDSEKKTEYIHKERTIASKNHNSAI